MVLDNYKYKYTELVILEAIEQHRTAWQAACEYKQEEYSNIMEAMTRTSQYNFKLQAELLEYKEAASSEAAFVNELQAENSKLKLLIKQYEKIVKDRQDELNYLVNKINELEKK